MIDTIFINCRELSKVSPESAEAYARATGRLLAHSNEQLEAYPNIKKLIGQNPLDMMRMNLHYHAEFMSSVFRLNSCELLTRTVSWLYRVFSARSLSYDYFRIELGAWQNAIHECLENPEQKSEILAVYDWLIQHHENMIKLSRVGDGLSFPVQNEAAEMQRVFLSQILHGDTKGCLTLVEQSIQTADDLKRLYLDVIWPVMVRIGQLWETNQISVAEEHLATAIVGRIMAALYPSIAQFDATRGKAVVSAGPNEFHEVGARMVADFMEIDGWDVAYLGANTPAGELCGFIKQHKPFVVVLSVATAFNLESARQLIQLINEDPETSGTKIMVGGFAFNGIPQLYQAMGADGYAADAESVLHVVDGWWSERKSKHA